MALAACGGGGAPGAPAAPEGIAVVAGATSMKVSWEPVASATGYHVYAAAAPGLTREGIATMPEGRVETVQGGTEATLDGLAPGGTYCLAVDAFGAGGTSPLSPECAVSLLPPAPEGLAATAGDGAVTLEWLPANGATSYEVYLAASPAVGSATWHLIPTGRRIEDASSPLRVEGLQNGYLWFFVVVAGNASGTSPDSPQVSARPEATDPTIPPPLITSLTATPGPAEATLSWTQVPDPVLYVVYVAADPSVSPATWESLPEGRRIDGVTNPCTVTGLQPGTTYHFVVSALRDETESDPSPGASATPNDRGTFRVGAVLPAGSGASAVVVADLDGDGALDIATANYVDGTLSLLHGLGDGGFEPAGEVDAGAGPRALAAGDVDGDGAVDLVVALAGEDAVLVLQGDGALGFSEAGRLPTGDDPARVLLEDVDGDGAADLLALCRGADEVGVWLGDGAGGFDALDAAAVGASPLALALGDLDGDGALDLVTADQDDDTLTVLLGDGTGAFAYGTTVGTDLGPVDAVLADADGDGGLEILCASLAGGFVECFADDGAGGFERISSAEGGDEPVAAVAADFDGDGLVDLAVADRATNALWVFRGQGDGTFQPRQTLDGVFAGPGPLVPLDVDGDGLPDLVTCSDQTGMVTVLLGNP